MESSYLPFGIWTRSAAGPGRTSSLSVCRPNPVGWPSTSFQCSERPCWNCVGKHYRFNTFGKYCQRLCYSRAPCIVTGGGTISYRCRKGRVNRERKSSLKRDGYNARCKKKKRSGIVQVLRRSFVINLNTMQNGNISNSTDALIGKCFSSLVIVIDASVNARLSNFNWNVTCTVSIRISSRTSSIRISCDQTALVTIQCRTSGARRALLTLW